jgi:hypothetical protein
MDRTTMLRSRIPVRAGLAAATAALGLGSVLGLATPAGAATTPTIVTPASRTGFGTIQITGTATPGATVQLYETAYSERPLAPADDWKHGGGPVTAIADTTGHYAITRLVDTGFLFAVKAESLMSETKAVSVRILPIFWVTTGNGVVQAHLEVSPMAEKLSVHIQRAGSGGTWSTVASGRTSITGSYAATLTGLTAGTYTFRASVAADPVNDVLGNNSSSVKVTVDSTPAPVAKAGDVQFNRVQYASSSLNGEYVRVINKTRSTINLRGWTVRDAAGHVYTFAGHTLGAGKTAYVHTGRGTDGTPDSAHLYWARTSYIWNNGGDTATLRSNTGAVIDSCRYTGASAGYTSC